MLYEIAITESPLIISAPQKCVIPKKNAMLCIFSFGITHFLGAQRGYGIWIHDIVLHG